MSISFWLIISIISGAMLGIISNIVANAFQPALEKRRKLLFSVFFGLLSFTIIATILSTQQKSSTDNLPPSVVRGNILYAENNEWKLKDMSSGSTTNVPLPPWDEVYDPSWSHDGNLIIFAWDDKGDHKRSLYTLDMRNYQIKPFLSLPDLDLARPSWSPDGTMVVFTTSTDWTIAPTTTTIIYSYEINTGQIKRLTELVNDANKPTWSPDSSKIVYEARADINSEYRIYMMDRNGENKEQVTKDTGGADKQPVWSPDGRMIAFAKFEPDGEEIWTLNLITKELKLITFTPSNRNSAYPAWSPDGRWLAYFSDQEASERGVVGNIYITDLPRSVTYRVTTTNTAWYDDLSWQPSH